MSFKRIVFASVFSFSCAIFGIINNSKEQSAYDSAIGTIQYLGKEFEDLPNRNHGDYRYLKISTYPYLFEIYEPNHEPTTKTIDDLQVGDQITIYYYEIPTTKEEGINRFTQFIDKEGEPYFIRDSFQKNLGYILMGITILFVMGGYMLVKNGKLTW